MINVTKEFLKLEERTKQADEFFEHLDGPLLKQQREALSDAIMSATDRDNREEADLLEGLQNLLDNLADIAHDQYGIDCLLDEISDEVLKGDWQDEVRNDYTCLGLKEYIEHRREMIADDKEQGL